MEAADERNVRPRPLVLDVAVAAWPDRLRLPRRDQFRMACLAGDVQEVRALVARYGMQVAGDLEDFETVVTDAVGIYGHLSILDWAVTEHGLGVCPWITWTCFWRACQHGHLHVCQRLIDRRGFCRDDDFIAAVTHRHWHVARWLLQREPTRLWPAEALAQLLAHIWGPARDAWMRSVVGSVQDRG